MSMCIDWDSAGSHKTVVLVRKSCGDPGETLSMRSLHELAQVLVRRSGGEPDKVQSEMAVVSVYWVSIRLFTLLVPRHHTSVAPFP